MEIDPKPLYEEDQVVTYRELLMMREGCVCQYYETHWWEWFKRLKLRSSVGCIHAILGWMQNGKPTAKAQRGSNV